MRCFNGLFAGAEFTLSFRRRNRRAPCINGAVCASCRGGGNSCAFLRYFLTGLLAVLLFLFIPSEPVCALPSEKMECGISVNFAGGGQAHLLYYGPEWNAGFSCNWKRSTGMAAFNGFNLAIGHLEESGLIHRLRHPSLSGLFELSQSEKTRFTARLRTASCSRFGAAWMPWNGRIGLAAEKTERGAELNLWTVALSSSLWKWEILGSFSFAEETPEDNSWYPSSAVVPGGCYIHSASRLIYRAEKWKAGFTLMGSGGQRVRPGYLALVSAACFLGEWKLGLRGLYASSFFRCGKLERLSFHAGGAAEVCRSPGRGFRFKARCQLKDRQFKGFVESGWAFQRFIILAALNETPGVFCKLAWFSGGAELSVQTQWNGGEEWQTSLEACWTEPGPLRMNACLLLLKQGVKTRCNVRTGLGIETAEGRQLLLKMELNGLPWNLKTGSVSLTPSMGYFSIRYVCKKTPAPGQ